MVDLKVNWSLANLLSGGGGWGGWRHTKSYKWMFDFRVHEELHFSLTINVSMADGEHGHRLGEGQGHGGTAVPEGTIAPGLLEEQGGHELSPRTRMQRHVTQGPNSGNNCKMGHVGSHLPLNRFYLWRRSLYHSETGRFLLHGHRPEPPTCSKHHDGARGE